MAAILLSTRRQTAALMPCLVGVLVPLFAVILLMISKHWIVSQDFRFVLPMLIPLVILYVLGMEHVRTLPGFLPCTGSAWALAWPCRREGRCFI